MKWWDIKQPSISVRLAYQRRYIRKFFKNLETRGGIVGDKAVLFIYNEEYPELSYIITEKL